MNKSNTLFQNNTAYRNIHTIIQCISENTNTIMILTADHDNLCAIQ